MRISKGHRFVRWPFELGTEVLPAGPDSELAKLAERTREVLAELKARR
jgi:hypothetical protein